MKGLTFLAAFSDAADVMQKTARPNGLRAIAERANVSVSLVSKVLNRRLGSTRVNAETLSAIHAAAADLGYRKNHAAAALVKGRQNVIGGFIHSVGVEGSGLVEQLVRGMADAASSQGQRLMLRFFSSAEEFLNYVPEISPSLLDGLIVAGIRHPELFGRLREIQASGVQVVTVHEDGNPGWDGAFDNVCIDQRSVCEASTEHLISLGCQRIAHISLIRNRADGYRQALESHGMTFDPSLVFQASSFYAAGGTAAVAHFAAAGVQYDGIVAQSDEQAIGALNALILAGRRVPQDVKVIGVDDSSPARLAIVPLSSVSSRFYEQGVRAVGLLGDNAEGRPKRTLRIEPVVRARQSTVGKAEGGEAAAG